MKTVLKIKHSVKQIKMANANFICVRSFINESVVQNIVLNGHYM